jgi:hypothetical protein
MAASTSGRNPGSVHPARLSREERKLLLASCLADFRRFCGLLQVVDYETGRLKPMRLTGLQRAYCDERTKRDLVLKSRKVFFTTLELARDLYKFIFQPGANVLVYCQTLKSHETYYELNRILARFILSLRTYFDLDIRTAEGRFEYPANASTLTLLEAGATFRVANKGARGIAFVTRLHASEIAVWEQGQEIIPNIIAGMPSDGEVTIESTPRGESGYFHEQWQRAVEKRDTLFAAQFFPWYLHEKYREPLDPGETIVAEGALAEIEERLLEKGVTPEQVKWYRQKFRALSGDKEKLLQEFPSDPESCWLSSGNQYIPTPLIDACISYDPVPDYIPGETYGGVDFGRQNHTTEVFTLRRDRQGHLWMVDLCTYPKTEWDAQMSGIIDAARHWGWRKVALDRTGIGSMPSETIRKVLGAARVIEVDFTEPSKEILATGTYACLAESAITLLDVPELVRDTKMVKRVVSDKGRISYDAPSTKDGHADKFWAMALAIYASGFVRTMGRARTEYGLGDFERGVA